MSVVTLAEWNRYLEDFPEAHFLQTGEWGELKSAFGWEVVRLVVDGVGAQVLFRKLPLGLSFGYVAKGPVGSGQPKMQSLDTEEHSVRIKAGELLWHEIEDICRRKRAALLKVEEDAWEDEEGIGGGTLEQQTSAGRPGFRVARHNIQPRRTVIVDLLGTEEEMLGRMKPKCRYNIRLAAKKGVSVHRWEDLSRFHKMMQSTGARDGFAVHSAEYVSRAFGLFHPAGMAELFVAEYDGNPLAALMVFARGRRAWYLYGASHEDERERMPNYLLQWEAMRWAKARGCEEYDLWGVPDENLSTLEANFERRRDGLWGVYRFKRGFGGELRRAAQARDWVFKPLFYGLYLWRMAGRISA